MPITPSTTSDNELVITFDKMSRGLDSRSQPTETEPSHVATGLQNAIVDGGYYQRIDGATLHATGMVMPDGLCPKDMAYYVPATGTACYIAYGQDGKIYRWTGSAWVELRNGLSTTSSVYATHTQIGDYLLFANYVDPIYKYDGTRCLPLGAKHIFDAESGETWSGGTADTTNYKQGTQGIYLRSTGALSVMTYTPSTPLNLTTGLMLASDYDTSDYIDFWVYLNDVGSSASSSVSATPSATPSGSVSATPSSSASTTGSATPSSTRSSTVSSSVSSTPSGTRSSTASSTVSSTPSATASGTPSSTPSSTASSTPSSTPSGTPSSTPSSTASSTASSTPSTTKSQTPSTTPTHTVSNTPSSTPSGTVSATPSSTVSSTPSATPSHTPSSTQSTTPTVSSTTSATPSIGDTGLDTAASYIRFGDTANTNYYNLPASAWGTGGEGWCHVHVLKSAFTTVGTPNWNSIAMVSVGLATSDGIVDATFDDCYMIYADVMPVVQYISNWKNMVIGAKTTTSPSDVVFSPVSSPDEYDVAADIPIDANDGTQITGIFPYYDLFLVTKDTSVHTLTVRLSGISYPEYVFGVKRVTGEHGASSHRAIVEAQGKVFMWWQGAIYKFEGLLTTKVSYRVDPTLHDFEPTRLYQAVACPYRKGNKIYLWWTPLGATTNTSCMIFDYQEQSFLPVVGQSMGWAGTSFESGTEYPLTVSYTGRVLAQSSGETFDGATISTVIPLPWVSAGPPHGVVSWREMQVHYATNTGTLVCQYRTANHPREMSSATWNTAASIDMATTGEYGRVFIGERSRFIQIRFTSAGYPLSLYWPIALKGRPLGYIQ